MSKKQKLEQLPHFSSAFYPKELPTKIAATKYSDDKNKPYVILEKAIEATSKKRDAIKPANCIAHWFVRDFRVSDNHALSKAGELAAKHNLPLVCFWLNCKEMSQAHGKSKFQMHYRKLSMEKVHAKLQKLNIPFVTVNAATRKEITPTILDFLGKYNVSHLFANLEYEVDELRLITDVLHKALDKGINFQPCHDSCVVKPGELVTKSKGTQFAVFTPWYRIWVEYVNDNYLEKGEFLYPDPPKLENSIKELMEQGHGLPTIKVDEERFNKYWKLIGEDDALDALRKYIKSQNIKTYDSTRDLLQDNTTSHMSVHISSGTISTRRILYELTNAELLDESKGAEAPGISEWVRQVSWRDFYKHIMCYWPYICMYKPFHLEYSDLEWEYNKDHYLRWCEGRTGFPVVDACMRCLKETGHMNNRGRLIVASFFAKDLLLDWRWGESYFLSQLVDADFASNNGGWGFSASTGVDPQPYFRIFNPWTQSERFDPNGDFIKKWVPELKDLSSKTVHNPYDSVQWNIAEENGYPKPILDHKFARNRALERYKTCMAKGKEKLKQEVEKEK